MIEKDLEEHAMPFPSQCPDCSIFIARIFEMK